MQAVKCHEQGDRVAAEGCYRRVLKLNPKHADAQHMLGALLFQLHGDAKVRQIAARGLHWQTSNGSVASLWSTCPSKLHCAQGYLPSRLQFEEGRALIQSAINGRPGCAKFRQSLGVLLQACGRHQEAVDAFERANEKDPMNVQVELASTSGQGPTQFSWPGNRSGVLWKVSVSGAFGMDGMTLSSIHHFSSSVTTPTLPNQCSEPTLLLRRCVILCRR